MSLTPSGPAPSPAPQQTSVIAPSPMGPGALVRTAWRLMMKRPGLLALTVVAEFFVGLGLMLLPLVVVVLFIAGFATQIGNDPSPSSVIALVPLMLVAYLAMLAGPLWAQIKYQSMQCVIVDQAARGMEPSWESAKFHTRGIGRRALMLFLLALGAVVVLLVVTSIPAIVVAANSDATDGADALGLFFPLLSLVLTLAAIYVAIRLVYVMQVLAIERLGGMASLRRAMQLTKGRFWATLGNCVVGGLAILVALFVGVLVVGLLTSNDDTATIGAVVGSIGYVLFLLASGIWGNAYTTTMYIDQVRRHAQQGIVPVEVAAPTAPAGGFAPVGGQAPQQVAPAPVDTWGEQPVGPLTDPARPAGQTGSTAAPQPQQNPWDATPQPQPQQNPWDAQPQPQSPQNPWDASPAEPTRPLGSEPTTQLPGEEPTRPLPTNPWERPKDSE